MASSSLDKWADPASEHLGCVAVDPVCRLLGEEGLVYPGRYPDAGDVFAQGCAAYHVRAGTHYLGREDWQWLAAYLKKSV